MKRIAFIASGLLAAQAASAGVYIESVNRDIAAGTTTPKQKIYVQNGSGRFMDPEGRSSLIKGNTLYMIDDKDKSYIVFDKATMEQVAKKLSAQMEQLKQQMAKLPPEQRAQMEQMLGGAGLNGTPRTVDVADTGKSDKVEGRACKIWDVTRDGVLDEQICVVPYSALPGKENISTVFGSFAKVFEEMAKSVPMLSGMMANEFSAYVKTNGCPVRQRAYETASSSARKPSSRPGARRPSPRRCSKCRPATRSSRCRWARVNKDPMKYSDDYAALGVERGASADQIKKAYRRLAQNIIRMFPRSRRPKRASGTCRGVPDAEGSGKARRLRRTGQASARRGISPAAGFDPPARGRRWPVLVRGHGFRRSVPGASRPGWRRTRRGTFWRRWRDARPGFRSAGADQHRGRVSRDHSRPAALHARVRRPGWRAACAAHREGAYRAGCGGWPAPATAGQGRSMDSAAGARVICISTSR